MEGCYKGGVTEMNKEKLAQELLEFINNSPSCFHAIHNVSEMLNQNGFQQLQESEQWNIEKGGRYYVTRNDSSVIAFQIPNHKIHNFQIIASHSDSPSFKIKNKAEINIDHHYVTLNVEKYGGSIMSTWFDRPLSIAGRLAIENKGRITTQLFQEDRDLLMIPSLAIHMNRKVNEGYAYNPQKDMIPLLCDGNDDQSLNKLLQQQIQNKDEKILGMDLFLYNRMLGTSWGLNREYISAPRLDDLQCVFSSIKSLINKRNQYGITMSCIFDNEEVGSGTKQGADSDFLYYTVQRIGIALGLSEEERILTLSRSFMVSADNAHALHPNYTEKTDPTNKVYLNQGIVIKTNANQKYTTDAISEAVFRQICEKAKVPVQTYVNRSDILGGSTLGNISSSQISIATVDMGVPQLAMHSAYETVGIQDQEYLIGVMDTFFATEIQKMENGSIQLL